MVTPSVGAVVLVRFPFSDLSQTKLRPAVVLADAGRGDYVLCQITSNAYSDPRAVFVGSDDLAAGSLRVESYARPGKLFTANESVMSAQTGVLKTEAFQRIIDAVVELLRPSPTRHSS